MFARDSARPALVYSSTACTGAAAARLKGEITEKSRCPTVKILTEWALLFGAPSFPVPVPLSPLASRGPDLHLTDPLCSVQTYVCNT